jgi:hypothetical protein
VRRASVLSKKDLYHSIVCHTRADFDKALDEPLTKQARTTCHERRLIDPERAHCFRARDHSVLAAYPVERSHRRESGDRTSHCQVQPSPTTRRGHLARLKRGKHPTGTPGPTGRCRGSCVSPSISQMHFAQIISICVSAAHHFYSRA